LHVRFDGWSNHAAGRDMMGPMRGQRELRVIHRGASALARRCGFSQSSVSRWLQMGWSAARIFRYALQAGRMSVEAYQQAIKRERAEERAEGQSAEQELHQETALPVSRASGALLALRIRREVAQAEKIEMGNRQLIAELIPVEQLVAFAARCYETFSAELEIPDELVHKIASENNPAIIAGILDRHYRLVLHNIARSKKLWDKPLLLSEGDAT